MTRKRTKKTFENYNDYYDRPFGLKWGTAFALSELTKTITEGHLNATKENIELPLMTREAMDDVLQLAFVKSRTILVQVNLRDENQNLMDPVVGKFEGYADDQYLYINHTAIAWDVIRHIAIVG